MPANVFIFNGRPNLENTISGIIYSIASGEGLPEQLIKNVQTLTKAPKEAVICKLLVKRALSIYSVGQLFRYAVKASGIEEDEDDEELGELMSNYKGVIYILNQLLGDNLIHVREKVDQIFNEVNVQDLIDEEKFGDLLDALASGDKDDVKISEMSEGLKQLKKTQSIFDSRNLSGNNADKINNQAKNYLKNDDKYSAKTWSMLYCGGSSAIHSQLKTYKRNYGIGLSVEKFDW